MIGQYVLSAHQNRGFCGQKQRIDKDDIEKDEIKRESKTKYLGLAKDLGIAIDKRLSCRRTGPPRGGQGSKLPQGLKIQGAS